MPHLDNPFPDPFTDETAEDPFLGPEPDDFDKGMGEGPPGYLDQARAPKRRIAIALLGGSSALLAGLLLFFGSGSDESAVPQAQGSGRLDVVEVAEIPDEPDDDDIFAQIQETFSDRATADFPIQDDDVSHLMAPEPEPEPEPEAAFEFPDFGDFEDTPQSAAPAPLEPVPLTAEAFRAQELAELEEQRLMALEREREEQARLQRQADSIVAWQRAEEARLRSSGTRIVQASMPSVQQDGGESPQEDGEFDFPSEDGVDADVIFGPSTRAPDSPPAGAAPRSSDVEILPGSRAQAVLETEFISDGEGAGRVIARFTSALRSGDTTVLPAGTRAFGQATASPAGPGRDARIQIRFDTYVTPDNQVIRGVAGEAADIETMSMSIPARLDRRYGERLLREFASTAIDVALASASRDRPHAFSEPSVWDMTVMRTQDRAARLVMDDIGDEGSVSPAVVLSQGTSFWIIYGF